MFAAGDASLDVLNVGRRPACALGELGGRPKEDTEEL